MEEKNGVKFKIFGGLYSIQILRLPDHKKAAGEKAPKKAAIPSRMLAFLLNFFGSTLKTIPLRLFPGRIHDGNLDVMEELISEYEKALMREKRTIASVAEARNVHNTSKDKIAIDRTADELVEAEKRLHDIRSTINELRGKIEKRAENMCYDDSKLISIEGIRALRLPRFLVDGLLKRRGKQIVRRERIEALLDKYHFFQEPSKEDAKTDEAGKKGPVPPNPPDVKKKEGAKPTYNDVIGDCFKEGKPATAVMYENGVVIIGTSEGERVFGRSGEITDPKVIESVKGNLERFKTPVISDFRNNNSRTTTYDGLIKEVATVVATTTAALTSEAIIKAVVQGLTPVAVDDKGGARVLEIN